jgi:hypothetical protein
MSVILDKLKFDYDEAYKEQVRLHKKLWQELDTLENFNTAKNKALSFFEDDPVDGNVVAYIVALKDCRIQEDIVKEARLVFTTACSKASSLYLVIDAAKRLQTVTRELDALSYNPTDFEDY